MKTKRLGRSELEVSRIGLGCVTFGREIDEETALQIMDYAFENGITLFDTAEAYGGAQARIYRREVLGVDDVREVGGEAHSSEKIIGRWLRARGVRKQIVLETKITTDFTSRHVAQAIEDSLDRLQTDVIDVYMFHTFDPQTPLEEGLEAITQAIRSKKIRTVGCSNFGICQLKSALAVCERLGLHRIEVIQSLYNLAARDIENELLPFCREQHIAVMAYSPLGAGFLSGKYTHDRNAIPRGSRFDVIPGHVHEYFNEKSFRVMEELRRKSAETGVPMVRLAMAWVLQNQVLTSVLVGARRTSHLDNALVAMEMDLSDERMTEMNSWK
jgi:aryl-alcohol dehydrogenase-like predicted oxidoreductase